MAEIVAAPRYEAIATGTISIVSVSAQRTSLLLSGGRSLLRIIAGRVGSGWAQGSL